MPGSTRRGTRRAARCSSDPPGSGAKIGTDASTRSSSTSGAGAAASMRATVTPETATSTGSRRPVTTIAVSVPNNAMSAGAIAAPIPIAARKSIWMTPNTRASTSSGTARWISVKPATSAQEWPRPMTPKTRSATVTSCQRPRATSGSPATTRPARNGGLRRLAPVSVSADTAPTNAPTPIAAFRYPTPPSPRPRSSIDATTMNTWTRPNIPVRAVSNRTSTRRDGSRASVVKPARRSAAMVDASSSRLGFSSRSTDMRRTNSADTAISAAVMVKTVPMLADGQKERRR